MSTIAVVIAVRDQAQFLGEALRSAFEQDLPPSEVVVVDDGSSDGTGEVAVQLGARVVTTEGIGPAAARNLGAAQVTSEFLVFLDGDDRLTPIHHASLLAALGGADAALGMVREFFDPGREAELASRFKINTEPQLGGLAGAFLIRRSVFDALGGFSMDAGAHESFGLLQRFTNVPSVDQVVLERRIHGDNRTIVNRTEIHTGYLQSARAAILARRREGG
jgi:glycosyltransferase involved in cell wall biosynthesis